MPVNHVLLETIELSQSASSVTFDNIPQTGYTDLKVVISGRDGGIGGTYEMRPNNLTTNRTTKEIYGTGAAAGSQSQTAFYFDTEVSSATAGIFGSAEIYIPRYTSSDYKAMSCDAVGENNATTAYMRMTAWLWSSTAAITSLSFYPAYTPMPQYTTFSLYGIAATGTTPTIAPKAQGGNIVANDGTYWYHAFLSSGTFTPTVALTCDYLVVAGGGGGGGNSGGGGGAGGYRTGTSLSLTASQYSVTIGSGGTGSPNEASSGTAGSDSIFSTITSTGGGLGAGYSTAGGNGGSGGGGNEVPSTAGGSGNTPSTSPSQGNNGAAGSSPSGRGGGGGGASAAGSAKNGGNGSSTEISGGSATGLGQLSSGTYYFAGGAGAGGNGASGVGGLGGGGTGCAGTGSTQTAGTANTGGGGGGGGDQSRSGRAGGSGVVIIRYTMA
jgi:hypothetical protein